jgi:probable addiction module antidote protein
MRPHDTQRQKPTRSPPRTPPPARVPDRSPNDAPATDDASHLAHSLGVITRARFMCDGAREAGLTREALYRSLSEYRAPRLTTPLGVMRAPSLRLTPEVEASP